MKRIHIAWIALMLFCGCAIPASSTAVPASTGSSARDDGSPCGEETVTIGEETPQDERDLPPAPFEVRFAGRFSETPEYGDRSYRSKSIDVSIRTYTVFDTYAPVVSYHVADLYVKDVTSIRTAAAGGGFHARSERTVKQIADGVGALLAIDGDTYANVSNSLLIRNGERYCETPCEGTDICVLYRDGRMETKKWGTFTAQEILDADPWQVWSFGPALLDENGHAVDVKSNLNGHNPRAAIGYFEPGHYCFVIVDGRLDGWSDGVRLPGLSQLMEDLGCKAAYNLDGGNSAQLYWNGEIISRASGSGRVVSDIVYLLPEE